MLHCTLILKKFNKINKRVLGNDYSFNNYAKNLNYLRKISQFGQDKFATIGNKSVGKIKHYGWLNLQKKKVSV